MTDHVGIPTVLAIALVGIGRSVVAPVRTRSAFPLVLISTIGLGLSLLLGPILGPLFGFLVRLITVGESAYYQKNVATDTIMSCLTTPP